MSSKLVHYKRGAKCPYQRQNSGCYFAQRSKLKEADFSTFRGLSEMTPIRLTDLETKEGEMALRSLISFKKRNLNNFWDKLDGFNENTTEESKCAKGKVKIARLQTTLILLKCLVSQNCPLEGWKALYFGGMKWCSPSHNDKSKSAVSKWARVGRMAAKVGKGLSKDDKGQKLALRHWLEVIDTHHRYGHNLHFYYNVWYHSQSSQPFFYWLDSGDGKDVNLEKCPRSELQKQCIRYLKPEERKAYEVIIKNGRLIYRKGKAAVHTPEGSKWIFVLSTSRTLYIGEKKKGIFHHSSFLAGGATIASGRLVAFNGVLDAIWPYSGHYCPTEKHFQEFIRFLEQHNVDLTNVKKYAVDDDVPPSKPVDEELPYDCREDYNGGQIDSNIVESSSQVKEKKPLSSKCTTGAGPRIACGRKYPTKLPIQELEHLNLSPRVNHAKLGRKAPIPSPRPVHIGLPTPRLRVSTPAN